VPAAPQNLRIPARPGARENFRATRGAGLSGHAGPATFGGRFPPVPAMAKKILLGLLVVVLGLQLVRPEKNLSPVRPKTDLLLQHPAPPEVKRLLEVGCYDCHSDNTRYPFYAEIQPVGWWLAQHVRDGKRELNFSSFGDLSPKKQGSKLEEIMDVIQNRSMPLKSYTITHRDAIYTDAQVKQINDWLDGVRAKVAPDE
jgi:hypothetical protein